MTDDTHSDGTENCPDNHQQSVEVCEHDVDSVRNGNLAHARTPNTERNPMPPSSAEHDDTPTQEQHETAFDCYD